MDSDEEANDVVVDDDDDDGSAGGADSYDSYDYDDYDDDDDEYEYDDAIDEDDEEDGVACASSAREKSVDMSRATTETAVRMKSNDAVIDKMNRRILIEGIGEHRYRLLRPRDCVVRMMAEVKSTSELIGIPRSASSVVLRRYKWKLDPSDYFDKWESILNDCGVPNRCSSSSSTSTTKAEGEHAKKTLKRTCGICLEERLIDESYSMPCGHAYCRTCWSSFVENALTLPPSRCLSTKCPSLDQCDETFTTDDVKAVRPDLLPKWREKQVRDFVDSNGRMRWCPGVDCKFVAESDSGLGFVTCRCGATFCLGCGEGERHEPATCEELVRFAEEGKDCNAELIRSVTKACPNCGVRIEKNQGCNHISCTHCNHHFCWVCMKDFRQSYDYNHGCNVWEDTSDYSKSDYGKKTQRRERLDHYYDRYVGNQTSQNFAKERHEEILEFVETVVRTLKSDKYHNEHDLKFLSNATLQVVECRRVLKYSFVHGYFLGDDEGPLKKLFETYQSDLLSLTEQLSHETERDLEKELDEVDKTVVIERTDRVKTYMKNVLRYVEEGMTD